MARYFSCPATLKMLAVLRAAPSYSVTVWASMSAPVGSKSVSLGAPVAA
ncbi:hypothetical protein ACGFZL_11635 [Streptomyces sp. NPDC048182]